MPVDMPPMERVVVVREDPGPAARGLASWYGPGFYGRTTACGQVYTETSMTVAHNSLPCGTKVTFWYRGPNDKRTRVVRATVNDTGGFAKYGRTWDMGAGVRAALGFYGVIDVGYRVGWWPRERTVRVSVCRAVTGGRGVVRRCAKVWPESMRERVVWR